MTPAVIRNFGEDAKELVISFWVWKKNWRVGKLEGRLSKRCKVSMLCCFFPFGSGFQNYLAAEKYCTPEHSTRYHAAECQINPTDLWINACFLDSKNHEPLMEGCQVFPKIIFVHFPKFGNENPLENPPTPSPNSMRSLRAHDSLIEVESWPNHPIGESNLPHLPAKARLHVREALQWSPPRNCEAPEAKKGWSFGQEWREWKEELG